MRPHGSGAGEESQTQNKALVIPPFSDPHDLESFLERLNVVDLGLSLFGNRFAKRPLSQKYRGLCVFHDERTPSLYLYPESNLYVCSGCGAMGGPLYFLYNKDRQGIDDMVKKCGLPPLNPFAPVERGLELSSAQQAYLNILQEAIREEEKLSL